jgi:hypothetical protein
MVEYRRAATNKNAVTNPFNGKSIRSLNKPENGLKTSCEKPGLA